MTMTNRYISLEDIAPSRERCIRCNMCKFTPLARVESAAHAGGCAAYEHFKFSSSSGGGMVIMANSLMDNRSEITEAVKRTVYGCTLCGLCDVSCKYSTDIEVLETLQLLRKHIFESGHVYPEHQAVLDSIVNNNHPLLEHVNPTHQALGFKSDPRAETLVWVGSHFAWDTRLAKWLGQMLWLLTRSGISYQLLYEDEPCTARAALEIGDWNLFREQSEKVAEAIAASKAQRVICLDSMDYSTLRAHTTKHAAINVSVSHISEFYADLLNILDVRTDPNLQGVGWHDPCYLGRLGNNFIPWEGEIKKVHGLPIYEPERPLNYGDGGVFEPPRKVLGQLLGQAPLEFERRREYAFSAGDGGQAGTVNPEFSRATAHRRLQEARNIGIRTVITECPHAYQSLAQVAGEFDIKICSLTELLSAAV